MKASMKVAVAVIALAATPVLAHSNEDNTSSDPTKVERINKGNPEGVKYKHKFHHRNRNAHTDDGAWQNNRRGYADQRGYASNGDLRYNTANNYNYGDVRTAGGANAPVYKGRSFWYNGPKRTWLWWNVDAYDYPEMNDVNLVKHAH